ncbi:MAG: MFS transporter, partial [Rhodobacterales bacterium 12-65-15]
GMGVSAVIVGWLLRDYDPITLVRVVQGCGAATLVLNLIALWQQEKVRPMTRAEREAPRPKFSDAWADLMSGGSAGRLLAVVVLGTLAFNMQDVLLEPYGGEVLGLSVSMTTLLTALYAGGALVGFVLAGRWLQEGRDPYRIAARGLLWGLGAFTAVIFAGPLENAPLFYAGAGMIGFGAGLFAVATLTAAMSLKTRGAGAGLALGAWGAAQATAAGLAIFLGGAIRDLFGQLAASGLLGPALTDPAVGYSFVYHAEIGLLFLTLAVLGPLVRVTPLTTNPTPGERFGIAEFPT